MRLAVIDAVSAVDLVASMSSHPDSWDAERAPLDEFRRRATDPDEEIADADASTAVDIAGRWVNPADESVTVAPDVGCVI